MSLRTCPDCGNTGAVPAIGHEHEHDNGYVPCPKCRDSVRDVLAHQSPTTGGNDD